MDEQNQYYDDGNQDTQSQPTVVVNQEPKSGSGMAIASLVLGIISFLLLCCGGCFSVVGGIIGLVFGIIALVQKTQGKGMAIAGVVLSSLSVVLGMIIFIAYLVASAA